MSDKTHPLANLIPDNNSMKLQAVRSGSQTIDQAYESGFVGAFDTHDEIWAQKVSEYDRDEFMGDTDGEHKFSEIHDSLLKDEADGCHVYTSQAFATFNRDKAPDAVDWLFKGQQDSGCCVDACNVALKQGVFGIRAADPQYSEIYKWLPAYWTYQYRGYCGAGWSGSACATQNKRYGAALARRYDIQEQFDFSTENITERYVTSTWCRQDCPQWLADYAIENHPWDSNAITYFDGAVDALKTLFQNKGQYHHGSNATSASSKPNTWKRIGGHMQTAFGGDWSDKTRGWFADKGCKIDANDFWVPNHQLWGPSWSGQCGDSYWPSWWGPKPEGAWVCSAKELLARVDGYAYLPGLKGVPGLAPPTPLPSDPTRISLDLEIGKDSQGRTIILNEFNYGGRTFVVSPKMVI